MADIDPPESSDRQRNSAKDVEVSREGSRVAEASEHSPKKSGDSPRTEGVGSPSDGRRGAGVGNGSGSGVASHFEVSVESGARADKTTCKSSEVEDRATSEKMDEESSSDKQRELDWSEEDASKDQREGKPPNAENKCGLSAVTESSDKVQQDTHVAENSTAAENVPKEEEISLPRTAGKDMPEEQVGRAAKTEYVMEVENANLAAKQKKCRLVCKDCGMRFSRRETYNLHRHFHAHEDDLTPLTCKECGLTFQHRSALIKHRNEHKVKEGALLTPKEEVQTNEEESFQCAECVKFFDSVNKLRSHNCSKTIEKPFHCPLCRQDFQYKVSITKHMMTHSHESLIICQECDQTFPNTTALRFHQRCHTALKAYECPECGLAFKHYSVMEDHRRKHKDTARSHLCTICGKTFKYSSLLHQHQYLHTGQKPFRCSECGKSFAFAQNMKAHRRQHRLREIYSDGEQTEKPAEEEAVKETDKGLGKENSHKGEDVKRTFKCPLCSQTHCSPANLRAHMLIHEAEHETLDKVPSVPKDSGKNWEKGHTCPHCPCVYRDESSLNIHLLSVHKPVAYLEKVTAPSPKQFSPINSDNVQGNFKSESFGNKVYKCSECEKTFRHRSVLELHMRIHSKDKPYECKVCGKGFRFSSYLQQHLIIHTGKKPFKCTDCGKDFAFLQNMRTHQKLHQEKPFRCTYCRKGYSEEAQLQQHMLSHNHEKPHKCQMCGKSFALAYLLRDHMNSHTGERPHRCDECDKSFSWLSSLLVHQKTHARKRQTLSQYNYVPISTRMRGRGSRGKRGGRVSWGWSRLLGGSGGVNSQPRQESDMHRGATQSQSFMVSSHMDLQSKEPKRSWMSKPDPQPVRWMVDGGEVMPVSSSQQQLQSSRQQELDSPAQLGQQQPHNVLISQPSLTSSQTTASSLMKESIASIVSSHLASLPKKSSVLSVSEQPKPATWSAAPTSMAQASVSSVQHDISIPSTYTTGAALWSLRPTPIVSSQSSQNKLGLELQMPRWTGALVSAQKEPVTLPKKEEKKVSNPLATASTVNQPERPRASGLAVASTSVQKDQSTALPISTIALAVSSTVWDLKTAPAVPKTVNATDKLVRAPDFQVQQKQVSPAWTNIVQNQAVTQKVPISIQYEPHRFGQGMGTPVWSFQNNPVGTQTILTGQLKQGNAQELQKPPIVTGTQIIINQATPFFSAPLASLPSIALPTPHPLHSVAVGALTRPPHQNIFFAPQAVMTERPQTLPQTQTQTQTQTQPQTQTLPLPQFTVRKEPPKMTRLPFAPDRLLQCMICGLSLPRELDLQMHYLQHAQGEI